MRALALLLALTVPACAECPTGYVKHESGCWSLNSIRLLPPEEFDKPWLGQIIESQAETMKDMTKWCAPNPQAATLLGCSTRAGPICNVRIAPDDYLARFNVTVEAVRRHEIAHCHGWPASHPR